MSDVPELDKQSEIIHSGKAQLIQDFIDWIDEKGMVLARAMPNDEGYHEAVLIAPEKLMADFFGIDLDKIESERRWLLELIRLQS